MHHILFNEPPDFLYIITGSLLQKVDCSHCYHEIRDISHLSHRCLPSLCTLNNHLDTFIFIFLFFYNMLLLCTGLGMILPCIPKRTSFSSLTILCTSVAGLHLQLQPRGCPFPSWIRWVHNLAVETASTVCQLSCNPVTSKIDMSAHSLFVLFLDVDLFACSTNSFLEVYHIRVISVTTLDMLPGQKAPCFYHRMIYQGN